MIGGFYVVALQGDKPGLVAGPFATQAEAQAMLEPGRAFVCGFHKDAPKWDWGICQAFFSRLVSGRYNTELWARPTPTERN